MKVLASVALLAAAANAAPTKNDKFDIYGLLRQKHVDEINATPGITWTAAVNDRFNGMSDEDLKDLLGVKPGNKEHLLANAVPYKPTYNTTLPDSFDSEKNWPACARVIGDIRDQSMCGCCWAFGAASAASDRLCIATKAKYTIPLSAQDTCFNSEENGCQGGQLYTPWSYYVQNGVTTGGQYKGSGPFGSGWCSDYSLPHCHHHGPQRNDPYPPEGSAGCPQQSSPPGPTQCDSTAKAPHNNFNSDRYSFQGQVTSYSDEQSIKEAIHNDGPIETAFSVYSDFANYAGGIYSHTSGQMLGGHAVRIVGWGSENGTPYWKVANSWNPYWGEKGYFRIKRGEDECGIESQGVASSMGAKWGKFSELN